MNVCILINAYSQQNLGSVQLFLILNIYVFNSLQYSMLQSHSRLYLLFIYSRDIIRFELEAFAAWLWRKNRNPTVLEREKEDLFMNIYPGAMLK